VNVPKSYSFLQRALSGGTPAGRYAVEPPVSTEESLDDGTDIGSNLRAGRREEGGPTNAQTTHTDGTQPE
jgi:hypothetical protein